jgi:hypothetical protein
MDTSEYDAPQPVEASGVGEQATATLWCFVAFTPHLECICVQAHSSSDGQRQLGELIAEHRDTLAEPELHKLATQTACLMCLDH